MLADAFTLGVTPGDSDPPLTPSPRKLSLCLIPSSLITKVARYQPIDTLGSTMHHPSNGSPRTANTLGFWLYMRSNQSSDSFSWRTPSLAVEGRKQKTEK
ncbi:hypothetical protein AVEN_245464-1 [Araneus ventricosus]|uniref:Uncharacterized protein n=1 Tax=Araneus ventricosus TaxID=182803 RepID=A0A4Y2D719_ARAVE|nr:hypothetical protein AVEN_245464-1 [Araneus ventricosus]